MGLVFNFMNDSRPSILGIAFLTVFLDIVGFSILFPLFPAILDWYVTHEGPQSSVGQLAAYLQEVANGNEVAVYTLFGGVLGSLYGLLQFVFSVVWGGLSDRIGRRPTLLFTLFGTAFSYVVWTFAGSFSLLVTARILGGIMAGNISTASAAVADTTTAENRAKGMGIIGMGIGLGFIMGPALGGFLAGVHLESNTVSRGLALHPFSGAALASLGLAVINLVWALHRFPETLPPERRSKGHRPLNPFKVLRALNYPGVKRANLLYLVFLTAFAAVEFTLTFLAVERLNYAPSDLAWMFVYVGLIIAFVQGGIVRRMAPKLGERLLTQVGLACNVPGFLLLAFAHSSTMLYAGLGFMAVGSGLVSPCLSALVSRYSPPDKQGLAMGSFRSMGSLSRAVGPMIGAVLYWKFQSSAPYLAAAALLVIPLLMALKLPQPAEEAPNA